jgi:dolichol-phosphate mannosyltransferase
MSEQREVSRDGTGSAALLGILVAMALKIAFATGVELLPEETYYWSYSRHLDYGYLDHPPMVAWLIRLGTGLFGHDALGVRAGALLCGGIASGFMFALVRRLFGASCALGALVLMQVLPFFYMAGLLMTPDAPLTAAWSAALYFLARALLEGRERAWWGVGAALGLGLLSKYTIALLGLAALAFILSDRDARRWLLRIEPYGAALLALAVFSPVILWNAQHQWASFLFQTSRRLGEASRFSLHKLLGSVIVLLTPTGVLGLVPLVRLAAPGGPARAAGAAGTTGTLEAPRADARVWRFLALAAGVPLAVFTLFSLFHEVKLDWTGAPWVGAVPALAAGSHGALTGLERWAGRLRSWWRVTVPLLLLAYAVGFYYLAVGWHGAGYGRHAELVPVGWRTLALEVSARAHAVPGPAPLVVGMDRYAIASELAFYSPDPNALEETTSAHLFGGIGLMYERWFPAATERGRSLLLVAWRREDLEAPEVLACVTAARPIVPGELHRADGEPIRAFYTRLVLDYRGPGCAAAGGA